MHVYDAKEIKVFFDGKEVATSWPNVEILDDDRCDLSKASRYTATVKLYSIPRKPMRYGFVFSPALLIASHGVWT
jgi:hypothetical protein